MRLLSHPCNSHTPKSSAAFLSDHEGTDKKKRTLRNDKTLSKSQGSPDNRIFSHRSGVLRAESQYGVSGLRRSRRRRGRRKLTVGLNITLFEHHMYNPLPRIASMCLLYQSVPKYSIMAAPNHAPGISPIIPPFSRYRRISNTAYKKRHEICSCENSGKGKLVGQYGPRCHLINHTVLKLWQPDSSVGGPRTMTCNTPRGGVSTGFSTNRGLGSSVFKGGALYHNITSSS